MSKVIRLQTPLNRDVVRSLYAGDQVELSGTVYTGRDAAHQRMMECLERGGPLPFPIQGAVIYYVGPTPTPPGKVIGAAGPTTSGRMDSYSPRLIELGLTGMIGKGFRSKEVREACIKHGAVYFAAIGGAGALMAQSIRAGEVIAWEELGPEAVRRLTILNMPLVVINDCHGGDLYEEGKARYQVRGG